MNAPGSGVKAFLGFMDHSITEQLIGNPDARHTTAIVLAEGGECGALAKRIGGDVNRRANRLRKWSRAGEAYRRTFLLALSSMLPGSGVVVVASSARERTILANRERVACELGLADIIQEELAPRGTARMKVGPFIDHRTGLDHFFESSSNRILMVLWIAHFILRAHASMAADIRRQMPALFSLDWFLYLDKFAGDNADAHPASQLFQTLVGHPDAGNIRTASFVESDRVSEDLMADNIAGLLNEWQTTPSRYRTLEALITGGSFYYESDA
jgi:hypothetical protein